MWILDISVSSNKDKLIINQKEISFLSIKKPLELPWNDLDIDIVLEATGVFSSYKQSKMHLDAGAKRVVISAPVKDNGDDVGVTGSTVLMGLNEEELKTCQISSNASCTTNAGSPIISILNDTIGIEKALLNTVHSYTATQSIIDTGNKKDFRKGRAGAQNIIPSSTGAAIATTKVITDLENKFDGIALRVPVIVGSIVDITFISKKETTVEEVNEVLTKASQSDKWIDIFSVTKELLVSSDIVGSKYPSMADLSMTRVVGGNLVKVLAWYDNETGYANTLAKHILKVGQSL